MKEKINIISHEKVENQDLDYLIREYLVHSGYQESFMALETESNKVKVENDNMKLDNEFGNLSWKKDSINNMEIEEIVDLDKIRKYSDDGMTNQPELRKRTLSLMIERVNSLDDSNKSTDVLLIMNFLKERKIINNMITEKDYETALVYFQAQFKAFLIKNETIYKKIYFCLIVLIYLELLRRNDYHKAYEVLNSLDTTFWNRNLYVMMYDKDDKLNEYNLEVNSFIILEYISTSLL
jgi:hypothetical protein